MQCVDDQNKNIITVDMLQDIIDFLWMVCLLNVTILLTTANVLLLKILLHGPKPDNHDRQ